MDTRYGLTANGGKKARKHAIDPDDNGMCNAVIDRVLSDDEADAYDTCGNCARKLAALASRNPEPTPDAPPAPDAAPEAASAPQTAPSTPDPTPTPAAAPTAASGRVTVVLPVDTARAVASDVLDDAVDAGLIAAITGATVFDRDGVPSVRLSLTPESADELNDAVSSLAAPAPNDDPETVDAPAPAPDADTGPVDAPAPAPDADTGPVDAPAPAPDADTGPDDAPAPAPDADTGPDDAPAPAPDADGPGPDTGGTTEPDAAPSADDATPERKPRPRAAAPDVPPDSRIVWVGERLLKFITKFGYDPNDPEDAEFIRIATTSHHIKMGRGGRVRMVLTSAQVRKLDTVVRDMDAKMATNELPVSVTGFRRIALPKVLRQCRGVNA